MMQEHQFGHSPVPMDAPVLMRDTSALARFARVIPDLFISSTNTMKNSSKHLK